MVVELNISAHHWENPLAGLGLGDKADGLAGGGVCVTTGVGVVVGVAVGVGGCVTTGTMGAVVMGAIGGTVTPGASVKG